MKIIRFVFVIVVLFAVLFLNGCASGGGGGSGGNQPPSNPPSQPPPAPIATLTSSARSIFHGEFFLLTWSSTNASSCQASGGWVGSKAPNGSESVTATTTGEVTFSIGCSGPGGTIAASVLVTVNEAQPPTIRISPEIGRASCR